MEALKIILIATLSAMEFFPKTLEIASKISPRSFLSIVMDQGTKEQDQHLSLIKRRIFISEEVI